MTPHSSPKKFVLVSVPLRGNGYRKSYIRCFVNYSLSVFPSPCGVMVIGNVTMKDWLCVLFLNKVSVPLRGNGYRKFLSLTSRLLRRPALVSVPLRGNGYRKYLALIPDSDGIPKIVSVPLRGNGYRKCWHEHRNSNSRRDGFRPLAG